MGFVLQDRDILILQQITKFRFLLSRQIKCLCGFSGQRACDRRISKLIDEGLLERKYFIYGIPALYFVTVKAKKLYELKFITKNVRIENIRHDILNIDTAIYLIHAKNIPENTIVSERQIKHLAGFGGVGSKHIPDQMYTFKGKTCCVEIELNLKQYAKLYKNVQDNYLNYDKQLWFIDVTKKKLIENMQKLKERYSDIFIFDIKEVTEYVKNI